MTDLSLISLRYCCNMKSMQSIRKNEKGADFSIFQFCLQNLSIVLENIEFLKVVSIKLNQICLKTMSDPVANYLRMKDSRNSKDNTWLPGRSCQLYRNTSS